MRNKNAPIITRKGSTILERQHLIADFLPEYLSFCPSCKNLILRPERENIAYKKRRVMHLALNELKSYQEVAKIVGITRQRVGQIIDEYKKYGY